MTTSPYLSRPLRTAEEVELARKAKLIAFTPRQLAEFYAAGWNLTRAAQYKAGLLYWEFQK